MFQEGLDAILQRRGRGGAAGAGALHLQIHIALVETAIDDVAAIVGDRGADARFDQLLDLLDDVGVGGIVGEARILGGHRETGARSEEHTSELQYLMRSSYAVFCLKNK